jgi:multidrug efflux pump subunit AcrB
LVSEQLPERVEAAVTNPLERTLITLGRVANVNSNTSHGSVYVEVQFEGGATEQDLAIVTERIEQLEFSSDIVVTSRSTDLGPPSLN